MKTAIVTGGTKGIGRGLAEALLARGFAVAISGRDAATVRAAADALARRGPAIGVAADVASAHDLQRLWDEAASRLAPPEVWVNNAGYALGGKPLAGLGAEEIAAMVDTNVTGMLLGCRTAARGMEGRGGAIWNVLGAGSDGAYVPGMVGYATTKAAAQYLTRALARELGEGVRVNGLSPGLVITEGFLREHAKVPAAALPARVARVNVMADHVETVAAWMARLIDQTTETGRVFRWLTADKLRRRRAAKRRRDILSRYLG